MGYGKYKVFEILLMMLLIGSITSMEIVFAKGPHHDTPSAIDKDVHNCTECKYYNHSYSHYYNHTYNHSNCLNCTKEGNHTYLKKRIHFRYENFRQKFKEFRERYYRLIHKAEQIKGKAIQLKLRIQSECEGNFSACDPELLNQYINLTKTYLINRLEVMKIKLEFINSIINDSNLTLTIENITELQLKLKNVSTIDDLRALKLELITVYKEVKLKLLRYGLLIVLNVQNKMIDRTITLIEEIKLKVNDIVTKQQLQELENQLYNLKQEVENTINEFYNLTPPEAAQKIKEIRMEYISVLKNLRKIIISLRG